MEPRNTESRIMEENSEGVIKNCEISMANIKDQLMGFNLNKLKNLSKDLKVRNVGKTKKEIVDKILVSIISKEDEEMLKRYICEDNIPLTESYTEDSEVDSLQQRIRELEQKVLELSVEKKVEKKDENRALLEMIKESQFTILTMMKMLQGKPENSNMRKCEVPLIIFSNTEENISSHIMAIERHMEFRNIYTDKDKVLFLMMTLSPPIAAEIDKVLGSNYTYEILKNYLLITYNGMAAQVKNRSEIMYFKLNFGKDLGDQLVNFVQKINVAYKGLPEDELLQTQLRYIRNLITDKNSKLFYFLLTAKPTNIYEFIREMQAVHELDMSFKSNSKVMNKKKDSYKDKVCHNCNKKGHIARFCKAEKVKEKASSSNATKKVSVINEDQENYEEVVNHYIIKDEEDEETLQKGVVYQVKERKPKLEPKKYQHIILQINDKIGKGFVDSGSGITFVANRMIPKEKVCEVNPLKVRMANGSVMILNKESNVLLNFLNGEELKTKVFVIPDEIMKYEDILIGEDVMMQCGLSISYDGEKLVSINNKKCISYGNDDIKETIVKKVKVTNDCEDIKTKVFKEYKDLIPKSKYDVGKGILECANIEILDKKDDFKPPSYGLPLAYKQRIYKEFKEMEANGIVEERLAKFIHPLVVIPKKDGELRICGDFRYINHYTKSMFLPANKPYEYVYGMSGYKWYSKIDLKNAYFQVRYPKETIPYMGVKVYDKVYCFKRMAQGGKVSPIQFQCLATKIISDLGEGYFVYIDDFAVCSNSTLDDHINKVKLLLNKLREYDMKVNFEKSSIGGTEIEFIGYNISKKGAKIATKNINAFMERKEPSTKKELVSFLQSANYFRGNIPRYANITLPLQKMVNSLRFKSSKIEKNLEYVKAIELTKKAMMNPQYLVKALPDDVLYLETDCSQEAAGGVIYRKNKDKEKEVIMFYSKKLKSCKKDRCITYLELYAINLGVRKFKEILIGHKVIIKTDHKPLKGLMNTKETKFLELIMPLQELDYEIHYIQGKENTCADYFSRIYKISENKERVENKNNFLSETTESMAKNLFEEYHLKKGHLSIAKIKDDLIKECYKLMISKYKAVMIINKIMDMIKNCETCQLENDLKRRKRDKANPQNVLEILYMDFMYLENHTILVAEDGYSRYIWAEESPQADEQVVIQLLNKILDQCQIKIKEIRADKAKVFKGKEFLVFLKKNDIKINYAVSYEHYANSKVERAIRTLRLVLKKMEPEITHRGRAGFKNKLKEACRIMNTSVHGATKVKPFNLIYNYGEQDGQVLENVSDERIKALINNAINESPEKRIVYRKLKNNKGGNELATIKEVDNVTDVMVKPMNEKDSRKTISLSGYKNRLYSQEKGRS